MTIRKGDELVAFERVRVLCSTAGALQCAIGAKHVWLPREHIKGRLWSPGDYGTLLVRRWIALDRRLAIPEVTADAHLACRNLSSPHAMRRLRLLPPSRHAHGT
jgi:hypothetical protein